MMTEPLYMNDSYLKAWETTVTKISQDKFVLLEKTAFYPRGGGVEWDTGVIIQQDGTTYHVVYTGKFSGDISHEVDTLGLKEGERVNCYLDWDRRYLLMRYHTGAHVLSGVLYKKYHLKVTGNQLTTEKGRLDINMAEMDIPLIKSAIGESNDIIKENFPVDIYYISRIEAEKNHDLFKLAKQFLDDIQTIRVVDIKGFDRQADGGCHVKRLDEIGTIQFQNAVNKGKNFKRVYFTIR
jgi:misacylated tRNA(Ala) deacylase